MPTLFQMMVDQERNTAAFPIREYWLDIGRVDDFKKASVDYKAHFQK